MDELTRASATAEQDNGRQLSILTFHKVGEPPADGWETWHYVPQAAFVGHISLLRDEGWEFIDLATFWRGLVEPASLPRRAAMLTFDDGYRSWLRTVLPYLREQGLPGVAFVPTDLIGRTNDFDEGIEPREAICDWDELRALERAGIAVQSHAASHRAFSELERAEQEAELVRSKATLEAGLGRPVEMIAYPYGDDGQARRLDEATLRRLGYRAACLYGGGPNPVPLPSPYRLKRLAMGRDTHLPTLLAKR